MSIRGKSGRHYTSMDNARLGPTLADITPVWAMPVLAQPWQTLRQYGQCPSWPNPGRHYASMGNAHLGPTLADITPVWAMPILAQPWQTLCQYGQCPFWPNPGRHYASMGNARLGPTLADITPVWAMPVLAYPWLRACLQLITTDEKPAHVLYFCQVLGEEDLAEVYPNTDIILGTSLRTPAAYCSGELSFRTLRR